MSNKLPKQAFHYIWPTIIKFGSSRATLQYQLEALFLVYTTQKFVTTPPMLILTSQSLNKFAYYFPLMRGCYVKQDILFFDKAPSFTNNEVRLCQSKNKFIITEYQRLLFQSTTKNVRAHFFSKLNLMFLHQNTNNILMTCDTDCRAFSTNIFSIKYFLLLIRQIRMISKNVRCNMFSIKMAQPLTINSTSIHYKSNLVKNLTIHILCKLAKYKLKKYRKQYFWVQWIKLKKRSRQKSYRFLMYTRKRFSQNSFKRCFKSNLTKPFNTNFTARYKLFINISCYVLYKQKNGRF